MKTGHLFMADLLGFSSIIKNLDQTTLPARVDEWIALVDSSATKCKITDYQFSSDTIFASADGTIEGFRQLITFGRELLAGGLALALPLRGAIVCGDYWWTPRMVFGKAVVEAHEVETAQRWWGIACGPSIHPDLTKQCYGWGQLICYPVPVARGDLKLIPAVDWDVPSLEILLRKFSERGLVVGAWDVEIGSRVTNTMLFGLYREVLQKSGQSPHQYLGLPHQLLDKYVRTALASPNGPRFV